MNKQKPKQHFMLTLLFSFTIFCLLFITLISAGAIVYILMKNGIITPDNGGGKEIGKIIITTMMFVSMGIGIVVTMIAGKIPLKPINTLINKMQCLASGDFTARLKFGRPITKHPTFIEISDNFNKMAEELENTEMLRSDFINNFSHEFKTPIVSIAGFAKLLKRGNLTEQQKEEYLDIIETESMRLADMATNVLNLTKIENQTILTDVSEYNLSEQIRACVLLLQRKWSRKNIDFKLEFGEYMIWANEELLKQVWINLIDNAIKFSEAGGIIEIRITEDDYRINVSVVNSGIVISEENQKKIFNKFYQADESHAGEGNGIGLAIVKRVVMLHGGNIYVRSKNEKNSFIVELPHKA